MNKLRTWKFWDAALVRCLKTVCQTAISVIGTSALISEINITLVASSAAVAGLLSILTSLAGLPEVEE